MRVCLVTQQYPPETARGGIGTQTWNKARALASRGHEVHVLSCTSGAEPPREEAHGGVTVHRMRPPGVEFPVYSTSAYWLGYTWLVLRQLTRLMQSTSLDVVDFPEYGGEGFAYQLDRTPWNWVPVVVQLHAPLAMFAEHMGWPEKASEFYKVGTLMEGVSITHADALMACSANIADFTAAFYGVPLASIDVVHCGVDAEAFRPGLENGHPGERPTVLFVGNIALNKGVRTVLEAVLKIRPRHPSIRLQIVGNGNDDLLQDLRSQVHKDGAEANVEFLGFVGRDGLPELYQDAHVFCSPAQYEGGVANVYIEAMASGCPVIASTAGGGPEAVTDGETGVLVPPDDVEAVAAALHRVLSDEPLRGRMAVASRRRVEEYFAMGRYIDRVLAVYEKAIERSGRELHHLKTAHE